MPQNGIRKTEVESELDRVPLSVMNDMVQSMHPKERLYSTGYLYLSYKLCTKLSYRDTAEMLNLFQHRDASETTKLRTLSDCVGCIGGQIPNRLEEAARHVLKMYGFESEPGLSMNITPRLGKGQCRLAETPQCH